MLCVAKLDEKAERSSCTLFNQTDKPYILCSKFHEIALKGRAMTYLITANDQQCRISRMENTVIKIVASTAQFMNTFPFVSGANCPHSNQVITHRCQIFTSRIPADRMDHVFMALNSKKECQS